MKKAFVAAAWLAAAWACQSLAPAHAADLVFMSTNYAEEASRPQIERIIAGFKDKTGLTVEPIGYAFGEFQKNLLLRVRSRTAPDLAQISERWLPGFKGLPGIVDFAEVYGREYLEKTFAPEALAMGTVDGKVLALPMLSGSIGMVANREVLEKAGITTLPKTVDEFRATLVAVRDKVPNSVPYPMATKNNNSILVDFLVWNSTFGGRVVDEKGAIVIDTPQSRAALSFLVGLMKDRLIAPELDRPDSRRLFGQNVAAFYLDAPVARTFARSFSGQGPAFDKNLVPMPTPVTKTGNTPVSIQWGFLLIQFSADRKPARNAPTEQFLDHIASSDVQGWLSDAQSALPTTRAGREDAAFRQNAYLSGWSAANPSPRTNEVSLWSNEAVLTQILGEEVQAALLGQKSADDAITSMKTRMTEAMAKLAAAK
jgi:multiple sugar transport system substrate-binding protein